jgi:hypothetical protein
MHALHFRSRPARAAVEMDAIVTRANGGSQNVMIDDLSLDGCRVSGDFLIGDLVKVGLPDIGELKAQVRWAMFGRAGLRFIKAARQ